MTTTKFDISGDRNKSVTDPVLSIRDVSVTYSMDRGESRVLDNVSIDIQRGEALGIVGESGSGKSMFASSLIDAVEDPGVVDGNVIYHPAEGSPVDVLSLNDEELRGLRWEEIAMVMQAAQSGFNPTMSIRGHFVETIKAHGDDLDERMAYGRELLSDMYMDPDRVLDSYPKDLSGGMKQRALIALGLVLEPAILILDEPTGALDLLMQRSIVALLKQLQEKYEWTMLFITHDLPLISDISDRLAVMYAYQIAELRETEALLNDPAHPYTRALLTAVPNIYADYETMTPIAGSSPDPVNVPDGCSYHPRCPIAQEECKQREPELTDEGGDGSSKVRCFYPEKSRNEIQGPHQLATETDQSDTEENDGI
jgi:oligopeptide/dipeptide ABC transporter ATP-binding protein